MKSVLDFIWVKMIKPIVRCIVITERKIDYSIKKHCKFYRGSDISLKCKLGNNCYIHGKINDSVLEGGNVIYGEVYGSSVGFGTYTSPYTRLEFCKIGRFTSIGRNVSSVRGSHPINGWVSTSPCFFSNKKQSGFSYCNEMLFDDFKWIEKENKIAIEIGSDVWIGDSALIMEGVKIGNGAVIAAGAVVVKDVPDYAVVGGVPAKIIRYRFNEDDRNYLNDLKWWDKDIEWIKSNASHFRSIDDFKGAIKNPEKS